jgi:hypothetical protein
MENMKIPDVEVLLQRDVKWLTIASIENPGPAHFLL